MTTEPQTPSIRLVAISGSIRRASHCTTVLRSLPPLLPPGVTLDIFPLDEVPLYNADLDGDKRPAAVVQLKSAIASADGLVLCSPEYNYGIPGVLKNAIDWASRPGFASPLKGKPVLIMTASPGTAGACVRRLRSAMRWLLRWHAHWYASILPSQASRPAFRKAAWLTSQPLVLLRLVCWNWSTRFVGLLCVRVRRHNHLACVGCQDEPPPGCAPGQPSPRGAAPDTLPKTLATGIDWEPAQSRSLA